MKPMLIPVGILVCGAALVSAQEPGGPGPGGGGRFGFGFRGPGGFRQFRFGGPGGQPATGLALLGMAEVRKELGTTDEQQKKIQELQTELDGQTRESFGRVDFEELQDLEPEERERRLSEVREKSEQAAKAADAKLASVLQPPQLERLEELKLQREGAAALARPEVAKKLGLSEEQERKAREIQQRSRPQPGGGFGPPDFGRMEEERRKAEGEVLALLSDEQKAKWSALKGKEFKFPEPQFGGPGGMGRKRFLVKKFDKDGDGRLNREERDAARQSLKGDREGGRGGPGFGPRGGGGRPGGGGPGGGPGRGNLEPVSPGPHVSPSDVKVDSSAPLYDPSVLRTFFIDFEDSDWEAELADFHRTDVAVPATLTVDGKKYPGVGVHFRGMSSFMMVPAGHKRSLAVTLDFTDKEQRLYGYRSLNLLNSHEDPSFLITTLYSHIARQYLAAPKANFAKVVINGESWGVYVNAEQFNKDFVYDNFDTARGARFKVPGSPGADGGLAYLGENLEDYKRRYEIKTADNEEAWKALIRLCKTLTETPPDRLEEALKPILDVDGALWFLALDVTLVNNDGYWVRASDYCLYLDPEGKFHLVPQDMNEAFQAQAGFGGGGRRGGPGRRDAGRQRLAGEVLPSDLAQAVSPDEDQKKQIAELQEEVERRLDRILNEEQKSRLRRGLREGRGIELAEDRRPGGGRGPGGGPPGEGPGPGPGAGGPPGPGGGPPGAGGRGGRGAGPRSGIELDPLVGLDDARKPLRSRLLAVPALKARYLQHVRTIAEEWLDWEKLGPLVEKYRSLLDHEVEADTRKLESYAAFKSSTAGAAEPAGEGRGRALNFRAFAEGRRKFLLSRPEIQKAGGVKSEDR